MAGGTSPGSQLTRKPKTARRGRTGGGASTTTGAGRSTTTTGGASTTTGGGGGGGRYGWQRSMRSWSSADPPPRLRASWKWRFASRQRPRRNRLSPNSSDRANSRRRRGSSRRTTSSKAGGGGG